MKHVIWSRKACDAADQVSAVEAGNQLGGTFYDYLRNASGDVVGVEYYLDEEVAFDRHPAYRQFLEDSRVVLGQQSVQIVFSELDAQLLQSGGLIRDTTQDFGGECVVATTDRIGIEFSLSL